MLQLQAGLIVEQRAIDDAASVRQLTEIDIFGDGHLRDQMQLLVDDCHAGIQRLHGIGAENIYLGQLPHRGGIVNRSLLNYGARLQLEHLGLDIDPETPLKYLSIGQWQLPLTNGEIFQRRLRVDIQTQMLQLQAGPIVEQRAIDDAAPVRQLTEIDIFGANTMEALNAGVAIIYQELHLIPEMTVAENIYLGQLPHRGGIVNRSLLNYEARLQLEHLGLDIETNGEIFQRRLRVDIQTQMLQLQAGPLVEQRAIDGAAPGRQLTGIDIFAGAECRRAESLCNSLPLISHFAASP